MTNLEEFFGSPVVGFHVVVGLSITDWSFRLVNPNFSDLKSSTRISVKACGSINTVHIGDCIHLKRKRSNLGNLLQHFLQIGKAISVGVQDIPEEGPTPEGGTDPRGECANLLFVENCMKMKEIGTKRRRS